MSSFQKLVFEDNGPPALQGTVDGTRRARRPRRDPARFYQLAGFDQAIVKAAGELNQSRVLVNGSHVEHWLNGARVVSTDVTSAEFPRTAERAPARTRRALQGRDRPPPIALQCHTGLIWFRNIRLRELPWTGKGGRKLPPTASGVHPKTQIGRR